MILAELRHPALAPSPYVARRATKYNELLKDGRLLRVASSGEDRTDEHVVQGVQEVRALQGASRPHAQLKTMPKMSQTEGAHTAMSGVERLLLVATGGGIKGLYPYKWQS